MLYKSSTYSVNYAHVEKIKRVVLDNNTIFSGYDEPTILPVPDDAPAEIPRAIFQSQKGHSQITITPTAIVFVVNYDGEYPQNWDLCKSYLEEKFATISEFLKGAEIKSINFSGIATKFEFNEAENIQATQFLGNALLNASIDRNDLFDINCRMTYKIGDKYYVNIAYENSRNYLGTVELFQPGLLDTELSNVVTVTVDVNDRYAFNSNHQYKAKIEEFHELMRLEKEYMDGSLLVIGGNNE
jgi:hypothetical protein